MADGPYVTIMENGYATLAVIAAAHGEVSLWARYDEDAWVLFGFIEGESTPTLRKPELYTGDVEWLSNRRNSLRVAWADHLESIDNP